MLKKIMIVSNEHDTHFILGSALLTQGYSVSPTHNDKEAIGKIKKENFELFILDASKDVNVKKLTKIFRTEANSKDIPVIILCSFKHNKHTIDAWNAGADYCFTEPFVLEEVFQVIKLMLIAREAKATNKLLLKDETFRIPRLCPSI